MADKSPHHGNKWVVLFYMTYYNMLKEIALKHGYCLAIHGSMTRDMDLILIPWIEEAGEHLDVLKEIRDLIGTESNMKAEFLEGLPYHDKKVQPHGRVSYTIPIESGAYLDISIIEK